MKLPFLQYIYFAAEQFVLRQIGFYLPQLFLRNFKQKPDIPKMLPSRYSIWACTIL